MAVFHQRRLHQFVTMHAEQSQQPLTGAFQLSRIGRQYVGDVFRKLPRLHENLPLFFCKHKGLLKFKTKSA